jgi:predicted membrane channel-forming protein YqfA (hemolysin III family)
MVFLLTLFYPLSFCDKKRGSNFYIWTGIVFLIGQLIFVPKWPKGELVSL